MTSLWRRRRIGAFVTGTTVAVALVFVPGCTPGELLDDGVLTVGSDWGLEPFEFTNDGKLTGFDIELIDEVAKRLGLETKHREVAYEALFDEVTGGGIDVAISAIPINGPGGDEVAFSEPYFAVTHAVTATSDSGIGDSGDLATRTVAVEGGTDSATAARQQLPDAQLVEFPTAEAALVAVETGQADAAVTDLSAAAARVEDSGGAIAVVAPIDTDDRFAIALRQDADELKAAINEQLAALIADGTYEALYDKWFTGPVPESFQPPR